ncbi:ABC transporter substrate-binding protein [Azospirillum canadense]|uniref:ABC transporter substrate-binding protein n=1 Tax=Azospirillum canadense TaxID=403962 RepID=UPI0022275D01|nr:ABC transporter substrate-binding protein [Azospirillum canadense]MCW2241419.1 NitT/TauT family transport system substrate-binding protein [Azospirillum canadense]
MRMRTAILSVCVAALIAGAGAGTANARGALEKTEIHLAAAGLGFPYLPFMIASQRGYFKDEGLDVKIGVFSGGSKALEALLGGSADIVAGAYSNTITMAAKGQNLVSFAVQANCPDLVFGTTKAGKETIASVADLRGKRVGVSAPGSSFHMVVNYLLSKAGLSSKDVSIIGVGASSGAVAAARAGQIDALMINDPVATMLEDSGDLFALAEMRSEDGNRAAFGGDYTEASVYATRSFVEKNPNTVQAMANAIVRAERWMVQATPEDVSASVPPDYFVSDKALFVKAYSKLGRCLSTDGVMTLDAAKRVFDVLAAFDPNVASAKIDLSATFDNRFVQAVAQKVAKP